jgi:hypothetical protein
MTLATSLKLTSSSDPSKSIMMVMCLNAKRQSIAMIQKVIRNKTTTAVEGVVSFFLYAFFDCFFLSYIFPPVLVS